MSGWQPIETAPKDGTAILMIKVGFEPVVVKWACREGIGCGWEVTEEVELYLVGTWHPTHWMHLPEPPSE